MQEVIFNHTQVHRSCPHRNQSRDKKTENATYYQAIRHLYSRPIFNNHNFPNNPLTNTIKENATNHKARKGHFLLFRLFLMPPTEKIWKTMSMSSQIRHETLMRNYHQYQRSLFTILQRSCTMHHGQIIIKASVKSLLISFPIRSQGKSIFAGRESHHVPSFLRPCPLQPKKSRKSFYRANTTNT